IRLFAYFIMLRFKIKATWLTKFDYTMRFLAQNHRLEVILNLIGLDTVIGISFYLQHYLYTCTADKEIWSFYYVLAVTNTDLYRRSRVDHKTEQRIVSGRCINLDPPHLKLIIF